MPKTTPAVEVFDNQLVKVYPNPFADKLTFVYKNWKSNQIPTIRIFDLTGKEIQQILMTNNDLEVPLKIRENGLYFYQIVNTEGTLIDSGKVVRN